MEANSLSSHAALTTGLPEKEFERRITIKAVEKVHREISTSFLSNHVMLKISPPQIQLLLYWIANTLSKMRFGAILLIEQTFVLKGEGVLGVVYSSTLD